MSTDSEHGSLVQLFLSEASSGLARLWTTLQTPDGSLPDRHAVRAEYIAAHTLRGSASLCGFAAVTRLAERVETEIDSLGEISEDEWPARVTLLRELVDALRRQIETIERTGVEDAVMLEGSLGTCLSESSSPSDRTSTDDVPSDEYLLPEMEAEVYGYFAPEAQEYLDSLEAGLLRLEKNPDDTETIQELFRTAHTLKGSAYTVGFQAVGDLTHHLEDYLSAVREGRGAMTQEFADAILTVVDVVRLLMRRDPTLLDEARKQFTSVRSKLRDIAGEPVIASSAGSMGEDTLEPIPDATMRELAAVEADRPGTGEHEDQAPPDTARKLANETAVIRVSRERLERLLNLVGELVISRGRLEQRLLALEQLSQQVLTCKARMLDSIRGFEEKHSFTFTPAPSDHAPRDANLLSAFGGLEFDKYDDFNILARQIAEVSADVGESMSQLNGSIRKAREDMSQLQRLTLGMRDEIARARMVPIGTPFTRFRRAIREIAKAGGKEVSLNLSGESTEVDTVLVERLVDPLIHLVRNAVFHGIEVPSIRAQRGKPPTGTVYLHAAHRGNAVIIEVEDDGGGLDVVKIKAKAVALGLVRSELVSAMTDAEAIKLIFLPGLSTAQGVGEQAGRGIGLDVVKRVVEGMNGQIEVESEAGVGTKFTLTLPLTLLISTALVIRVGTERYAIPLPSVREVVMPTTGAIQDVGGRPMLQIGDEAVEVRSLARLLGLDLGPRSVSQPIVIIRTTTGLFGLAVDELLGRHEIVIKTLGELKPLQESCFGGATIDPEGRVILVIDVARLLGGERRAMVSAGAAMRLPEPPVEAAATRPAASSDFSRILLIDDSLSVRKFVGRMLERAGHMVDTALDGEEGIRRASAHGYKLIITDLEMPKLNGYEVIQALRERPQTKTVPILVMTTRAGEKHRQMALSVGASGYIAKPVEERALIQEVERWIDQYTGGNRSSEFEKTRGGP